MKVIICGAGQVGWQIARHLSGEKNDVPEEYLREFFGRVG
jgi:homoserine dehydrogenase